MKRIRCSYCGAEFEVPETVSVAVCPYCGSTIWVQSGEIFKEHYIYDLRIEYNKAYNNAIGIAQRQFAAPEDLAMSATPSEGMLHFVPLYLYQVKIRAECPENPHAGIEERWKTVLAMSTPIKGLTPEYRFPTRGRRFFEPRILKRGKYHQPDRDPRELLELVVSSSRIRAMREAYNECDNPTLHDESKWLGIIHYPFWQVGYTYQGKEYYGLVDASDGTVVYLEYPIGSKRRQILVGGAIGLVLAGALLGAGVGSLLGAAKSGLEGGVLASLGGVFNMLRMGTARIGRYRLK